jgi:predicted small integral membrane protein
MGGSVPSRSYRMKTLKASLVGSAVGTVAWLAGVTNHIWPAHPQWAVFFLTIAATLVMMGILPEAQKQK